MNDYVEFGRYLKSHREQRGLSRAHVVRATKIPATLVEALEEGEAERLPEGVFLVNCVRAFSLAVGLSIDESLSRLRTLPGVQRTTPIAPSELERARRRTAVRTAIVVVAGLVVMATAAWWLLFAPYLQVPR